MSILRYNNRAIRYMGSAVMNDAQAPDPGPTIGEGYWVHKDTGVTTYFDESASFIQEGIFSSMGIGDNASEVFVPPGIIRIDGGTFNGLSNLQKVTLPSSIQSIGNNAFNDTPGLIHLNINSSLVPLFGQLGTMGSNIRFQIKVPMESYDSYTSAYPSLSNKIFVINNLIPGSRVHEGYLTNATQRILNTGVSNIVIENTVFDGSVIGDYIGITLYISHGIIIRNCKFINFHTKRAISLEGCSNVSIYNCDFINVQSGIRIADCTGNVKIFSNDFKNILGETYTSQEGFGQAIQLMGLTGADNRVQDNAIENIIYESRVEDIITAYNCHHGDENPLIIRNNWVRGGGGAGSGDGASGGGINIGDGTGTNVIAEDNICVRTGGFGIGIAGGNKMTLQRNIAYMPQTIYSELGMGVSNWYPDQQQSEIITVRDNRVWGIKRDGTINHWWYMDPNLPVIGKETNIIDDSLNENVLPEVIIGVTSDNVHDGGYWIDKDTGIQNSFSISGNVFDSPSWKNNASEIKIPEGVTDIAANSLSNSPYIETLILPHTVTSIGDNILSNCPSFKNLYIHAQTAPQLTSLGVNIGSYDMQIKVQADSFDSYRLSPGWSQYYRKLFVLNDLVPGSRVHSGYTVQREPLVINHGQDVVIEGICFDSDYFIDSNSILLWGGNNIIIRNCKFRGKSRRRSIHMDGSTDVVIYNCVFEECNTANRSSLCHGGIRVFSNDFIKPRGTLDGGWLMSGAWQFTYCEGGDNRVQDNVFDGDPGESMVEDVFNLYSCHFDDDSPLINRNNWIRGGGPGDTSGGALIGDDDGVVKSKRAIIEDNIFVDPGQYGIQLSGGDYGILRNNKVYASQKPWSNVGIVGANWAGDGSQGNDIRDNKVRWTSRNGSNGPYWVHESIGPIPGLDSNDFNADIDETILPPKIANIYPGEDNTLKGWWEDQNFGKHIIGQGAQYIVNGEMTRPTWANQAIRVSLPPWTQALVSGTFTGASSLTYIELPNSLVSIADNCLQGTNVDRLVIPPSVSFIGSENLNVRTLIFLSALPPTISGTQNLSRVELIEVPDGSESSYTSVFSAFGVGDKVRRRNYDNGYFIMTDGSSEVLTRDHDLIFHDMIVAPPPGDKPTIREVKVPGGIKHLIGNLFLNAINLEKVILPDSLESIGTGPFRGCSSLTEINIPYGVKTLPIVSFEGCSSLREIIIPSSVDAVGPGAFNGEGEMTLIFESLTPPQTEAPTVGFLSTLTGKTIKVPPQSLEAYRTAPMWSNYASIIIANDQ